MEIWKDIKGYEGFYQVSNHGRVRSIDRYIVYPDGKPFFKKGRILSQGLSVHGYYTVVLSVNSSHKNYRVNRLVADAFIPNPNKYPIVNHINEIKTDNRVDNLEWCTHLKNNTHGSRLLKSSQKGRNNKVKSKSVAQMDMNGKIIAVFPSTMEVQRQLGFWNGNISNCCVGRASSYKGFKWKYV